MFNEKRTGFISFCNDSTCTVVSPKKFGEYTLATPVQLFNNGSVCYSAICAPVGCDDNYTTSASRILLYLFWKNMQNKCLAIGCWNNKFFVLCQDEHSERIALSMLRDSKFQRQTALDIEFISSKNLPRDFANTFEEVIHLDFKVGFGSTGTKTLSNQYKTKGARQ